MATYYNQKLVHINKSNYKSNYLLVGNDEIAYASVLLKYGTFKVYLSLAGNVDGFDIGLSRAHIMNAYKISERTYKYAVKELEEKGYLVPREDGTYDFYVTPYGKTLGELKGGAIDCTRVVQQSAPEGCNALHQGSATECPTNSSYISDTSNNNNLASSETNADATNNTNEETEAKSSASKMKNSKLYDKVDETEFVNSLSIEDFNKVVDKVKLDGWIDFKSLHLWFHDNYNVHISDFEVLRKALSRRRIDIENQKRLKAEQGRELNSITTEEAASILSEVLGDYESKVSYTPLNEPKLNIDISETYDVKNHLVDCIGIRSNDVFDSEKDIPRFLVRRAYGVE